MKERPILFSAPMVRAILSGAKTVTRRVCQEMPTALGLHAIVGRYGWNGNVESPALVKHDERGVSVWPFRASRCGGIGDRLWVREAWCAADTMYYEHDQSPPRVVGYLADRSALSFEDAFDGRKPRVIPAFDREQWNWKRLRGRPSIHMPRWASRLSLDVVSVGVERLQDITEDDARQEGIEPVNGGWGLARESWSCGSARGAFQTLWDRIGGDGAWRANPWVWRVEFVRTYQITVQWAEGKTPAVMLSEALAERDAAVDCGAVCGTVGRQCQACLRRMFLREAERAGLGAAYARAETARREAVATEDRAVQTARAAYGAWRSAGSPGSGPTTDAFNTAESQRVAAVRARQEATREAAGALDVLLAGGSDG